MTDSGLVNSDPGADPLVGTIIESTYEVLSRIGKGGMGSVYRAHHLHLDRTMAIKVLRGYASRGPVIVQRFRQEARALNLLNHPNIVSCYAFGFHDDSCYLVMDFVDGTTLADEIALHGKLSPERFRRIFSQVCSALQHAHTNGIVHRDLKPENIMLVTEDGQEDVVKLLDFGIAKVLDSEIGDSQQLTKPGAFMGSPLFMGPEQCRAETLDARSDIYSLGCVMYLAIAGRGAFDADSIVEIIHHQLYDPPPELSTDVPPQLANLIYSCLEKLPANRPATAGEVLTELESPLTASVKVRRPSRPGTRSSNTFLKKLMQHKLPVAAAAVLIAGSLGCHYYTRVVSLDSLRKTCDSLSARQSAMVEQQFSNAHPHPSSLSEGYLEIYKQTDKLLKSRIAYANALLDQDQVAQAVDVAAGLDLDIQRQQRTTRYWPILEPDTIDGIKKLGDRFASLQPAKQEEQAANCLYLAAAGHFVRMMNYAFLHTDALSESEQIVSILEEIHARKLDNACPTLHSLTEQFPIQHRPDAYIFAVQSAVLTKNTAKARLYSQRVRATIEDITQDRTCLRSQDTQGQSLLKAAQQLISLDMADDAAPLLTEAAKLCRLESPDPGPGAAHAGFLLATLGQKQHLNKAQTLKFIELSVRASQSNNRSQLPALVKGAEICQSAGDKKGAADYIDRALKAPRNDAFADLQMADIQSVTSLRLALMLAENGHQLEAQHCIDMPLKRMYDTASQDGNWNEYMQFALAAAHQYRLAKMLPQSRKLLQDVLAIALPRRMRPEAMSAELVLFGLDFDALNYASAIRHATNSLDIFERDTGGPAPPPDLVVKTYHYKATAEYRAGQFDASYRDILSGLDYLEKHPEIDALQDKAILTLYAGVDCSRQRRFEEAVKYLYQSRRLWEQMESSDPVLCHTMLGTVTTELSSALTALGRESEAKAAQTWLQTYLQTHRQK